MSKAPNYVPATSFAQDESNQASGRATIRTASLDVETANIAASFNELNANLQKLQRDDDKLRDLLVEPYALSEQTRAMMAAGGKRPRGAWVPNENYLLGDMVQHQAVAYMCSTAHNAGPAFNLGFWIAISGDGSAASSAQQAATSASSASASAAAANTSALSADASSVSALLSKNAASDSQIAAQNAANSIAGLSPVNLSTYMLGFLANNNAAAAVAELAAISKIDAASAADATKGSALVGFNATLAYAAGTVGSKLRQFRTFKDFGAVGDGVANDSAAIALAIASNADVYDDTQGATYRLTSSVAIPNSCFTRFHGAGNVPVPKSKFFVDFNGPAFTSALGNTSFYCFENFYCYSTEARTAAQFIKDSGNSVHCELKRLVLRNFKGIALDLTTAFRCNIDVLIEYCWNYGVKIGAGSATRIKFTADHSHAGGIDINGGGFVIEPYTEMICSDNNPAGLNASWREMIIRGAQHTVLGGVMSVHPQNNKFPIELAVARAVTFQGVRGFSLGAAPHWINLNATDSSAVAIDCPDFTYGGTTTNLMVFDSGHTTTKPDITVSGQSVRNTTARVWCCFDGVTGANRQASGLSTVSRTGIGVYRLTWPAGTFANVNYVVKIAVAKSGTVVSARYDGKLAAQIDIQVNNSATAAVVDADEVCVELTGV